MFRLLAAQQADVIALQEVTPTFLMWLRDEAWVRDTYFLSDSVGTTLRGSFAYGVIFLVRRAASLRVESLALHTLPSLMSRAALKATIALAVPHVEGMPGPSEEVNLDIATAHLESLAATATRAS